MQNATLANYSDQTIWIVEDNLLILQLIMNKVHKALPNTIIIGYSSIKSAAMDLFKISLNKFPSMFILDFDFGHEGTVEEFLQLVNSFDVKENLKVILHTDSPIQKIEGALKVPVVKAYVPKSADFHPLIDKIITH